MGEEISQQSQQNDAPVNSLESQDVSSVNTTHNVHEGDTDRMTFADQENLNVPQSNTEIDGDKKEKLSINEDKLDILSSKQFEAHQARRKLVAETISEIRQQEDPQAVMMELGKLMSQTQDDITEAAITAIVDIVNSPTVSNALRSSAIHQLGRFAGERLPYEQTSAHFALGRNKEKARSAIIEIASNTKDEEITRQSIHELSKGLILPEQNDSAHANIIVGISWVTWQAESLEIRRYAARRLRAYANQPEITIPSLGRTAFRDLQETANELADKMQPNKEALAA